MPGCNKTTGCHKPTGCPKPPGCSKPPGCPKLPLCPKIPLCPKLPGCHKTTGCRKSSGCHVKVCCQVQCCKLEVVRKDQVSSRYCKKHTCDHFWEPYYENGPPCELKKEPTDSVCSHHVSCLVTLCTNGRMQYQDPKSGPDAPQYKRRRYCCEHTCSDQGCFNQRVQIVDEFRQYCETHLCHFAGGCSNRSVDPSEFCQRHKCAMCLAPAVDRSTFCQTHNRCEWPMPPCPNPKERGQIHCRFHITCEDPNCPAPKAPDSRHCGRHTCPVRNCPRSSGDHHLCDNHRCHYEDCEEHQRTGGGMYCSRHSCRSDGCPDCVNDMGLYCDNHACGWPCCCEEAEYEGKCKKHLKACFQEEAEGCLRNEITELRQSLQENKVQVENLNRQLLQKDEKIRRLQQRSGTCCQHT